MRIRERFERMPEEDLRRNVMTIRFRDREHQVIADEAWRQRMSMSGWIRDTALKRLREEGLLSDEK